MDELNPTKNTQETASAWDAPLTQDEFKTDLLDGEFNFTVLDFSRDYFNGSAKLPPSPKAVLDLKVFTEGEPVFMRTDLIICKRMEWKTSEFFRCIGQKKPGETLVPRWDEVPGSMGRAVFKPRTYKTAGGEERQANNVERFINYDPAFFPDNWLQEAMNTEQDELEGVF